MSKEFWSEYRGKFPPEIERVIEAHATVRDLSAWEVVVEVMGKWAGEQTRIASLVTQPSADNGTPRSATASNGLGRTYAAPELGG